MDYAIFGDRQTGKTIKLIGKMIADKNAILVCPVSCQKLEMEYRIKKYREACGMCTDYNNITIVTSSDFFNNPDRYLRGKKDKPNVYFDDIEACINYGFLNNYRGSINGMSVDTSFIKSIEENISGKKLV